MSNNQTSMIPSVMQPEMLLEITPNFLSSPRPILSFIILLKIYLIS